MEYMITAAHIKDGVVSVTSGTVFFYSKKTVLHIELTGPLEENREEAHKR